MYGGLKMKNGKWKEKIEELVKNCGKMLGGKNEKTVIQFDNEKRRRMPRGFRPSRIAACRCQERQ
jgi:hypothetical protein